MGIFGKRPICLSVYPGPRYVPEKVRRRRARARVLLRAALSSFVRFLQNPLPGLLTSLYTSDKI